MCTCDEWQVIEPNVRKSDQKKSRICPIWGPIWPTLEPNLPSLHETDLWISLYRNYRLISENFLSSPDVIWREDWASCSDHTPSLKSGLIRNYIFLVVMTMLDIFTGIMIYWMVFTLKITLRRYVMRKWLTLWRCIDLGYIVVAQQISESCYYTVIFMRMLWLCNHINSYVHFMIFSSPWLFYLLCYFYDVMFSGLILLVLYLIWWNVWFLFCHNVHLFYHKKFVLGLVLEWES